MTFIIASSIHGSAEKLLVLLWSLPCWRPLIDPSLQHPAFWMGRLRSVCCYSKVMLAMGCPFGLPCGAQLPASATPLTSGVLASLGVKEGNMKSCAKLYIDLLSSKCLGGTLWLPLPPLGGRVELVSSRFSSAPLPVQLWHLTTSTAWQLW